MTTLQASQVFLGVTGGLALGSLPAPVMAHTLWHNAWEWRNNPAAKTSIVVEHNAQI
jgi:hypothetical protein